MRLIFAHGLESGPEGRKTAWLREAGHDVVAPDGRDRDLAGRIEMLIAALRAETELAALRAEARPPILVGSSFGGIAGLLASIVAARGGRGPRAILLCAPALQLPPPPPYEVDLAPPCPAAVVHGTRDAIIPVEIGHAWAIEHGAHWYPCDDDHRLGASRSVMLDALASLDAESR
jgi:pimeloyl-ACP methyl ester carboxylesterase